MKTAEIIRAFQLEGIEVNMVTRYTPQPICPHCGYVERDAWEIDFGPGLDGDTEVCCGSCGEDYFCEREVTMTYRTSKLTSSARGTKTRKV